MRSTSTVSLGSDAFDYCKHLLGELQSRWALLVYVNFTSFNWFKFAYVWAGDRYNINSSCMYYIRSTNLPQIYAHNTLSLSLQEVPYLMAYNTHKGIGCTTISAGHTERKKKKKNERYSLAYTYDV